MLREQSNYLEVCLLAPWYVYVIAVVVALPIFVLLAVAGLGLAKALLAWVFGPDPASVQPTATTKGRSVRG